MEKWKTEKVRELLLDAFQKERLPVEKLENKRIFITGGTGLIGKIIVRMLAAANEMYGLNMRLILLVRDAERAQTMFLQDLRRISFEFIQQELSEKIQYNENIDYLIHGASITKSQEMLEHPLNVIEVNVNGTENILSFAVQKKASAVVFLSSMEVYGFTTEERLLNENCMEYINPLQVRSCYPESKRMAENLCIAYEKEYSVPVKIARLGQTFGYGVDRGDTRVFSQFIRCKISGENISLLTPGDSTRMYLDTIDAATGIITVLLRGNTGEAYNVANKNTYCSIKDMADMVANDMADGHICVIASSRDNSGGKFPPPHRLKLDTTKIESLGWKPLTGLKGMYRRLLEEIEGR